jgi:hypothetical protein
MVFIPCKPPHTKYALKNLNETQYKIYAKQYSCVKAGGIRAVYGWAGGLGLWGVAKDVTKGVVIDYGKRKLAAVCINAGAYVISPAVVVFTNASKIVNISKAIHSTAAFCFECVEDSSNLVFLPLDMAFFGQPIPIGAPNRFNLFAEKLDFLDINPE